MFDTMTLTKAGGAVFGSLLIFLLGGWASESLYHVGPPGHGGEEEAQQAYLIEVAAPEESVAEEDAADFTTLYAAADAAKGEGVFKKCSSCHKLDGTDGTGPHLNGVVDRPKAAVAGFGYSEAILAVKDQAWTPENLNGFLENPKGYMPGTKMSFAGLPKAEDRANLIAWLATQQ